MRDRPSRDRLVFHWLCVFDQAANLGEMAMLVAESITGVITAAA